MDHINLFQTEAEFDSAYNGSDYVEPWVSYTRETSGVSYNKSAQPHDYSQDYLTFVFSTTGNVQTQYDDIYFSDDNGETWTSDSISVSTPGTKVLAKGNVKNFETATVGCFGSLEGEYSVEGNVMSIYDSEGFRTRTTFDNSSDNLHSLFSWCTGLTSAENLVLPVTALTNGCYGGMFCYCENLITAPALPATTLTSYCYENMFMNCTNLTTAPILQSTTLAENCYESMFNNCRSLTTAPELPATVLVNGCYTQMFRSCSSLNYIKCLATDISATATSNWIMEVQTNSGTFVKPSTTDWSSKTGNNGIPANWTVENA